MGKELKAVLIPNRRELHSKLRETFDESKAPQAQFLRNFVDELSQDSHPELNGAGLCLAYSNAVLKTAEGYPNKGLFSILMKMGEIAPDLGDVLKAVVSDPQVIAEALAFAEDVKRRS
jgi:hypothetical protein